MLVKCKECNQDISDSAISCPHCGYTDTSNSNYTNCQNCKKTVLPVTNPHDTISMYCPLCNTPITNLTGRKVYFTVIILIIIFTIYSISTWELKGP